MDKIWTLLGGRGDYSSTKKNWVRIIPFLGLIFTAEKRNKHARVLTVCQALSLKKFGNFVDRVNKTGYELCMLAQNSRKQQDFNAIYGKLVYSFRTESIFLVQN